MVRQRGHGPCHRGREPLRRSDQAGARRARSDRAGPGPAPEERRAAHRARMVGGARARPRGSLRACPAGRSDGTARPEDRARDVRHAHLAGDPALHSAARPRSRPAARQDRHGACLMRVAISLRVADDGWEDASRYVVEAERLGVDCVWSQESWGHDAVTPLAFVAARTSRIQLGTGIIQAGTRTPALIAMTAMSLAGMSRGRFLLGLGVSGPQVIEGWHGIRFDQPVQRMRETIDIVRQATRGERVSYKGRVYELPLPGGEGKALRSAAKPQPNIPIYLATLSPKSLEMTGEIADGWLGTSFMPEHARVFLDPLEAGAKRAGRSLADVDLQVPAGVVAFSDDVERLIPPRKPGLAFTLGAMGSRQHNFYNDAYRRAGYADAAAEVQRLWLDNRREDAAARVPDELVLKTNLLGTDAMIRRRLELYRRAGITTLRVEPGGEGLEARLTTLGRLLDLIR